MSIKKENVDGEAFRNNFTRLAPGLEMYSTLRQQLAATDSTVSLTLVFRDEAFRCTVLMRALAAQGHAACRRPLSLNAQFHRELCRCSFSAICFSTRSRDFLLGSENRTVSLWFLNLLSWFAQITSLTPLLCHRLGMKCSCNHRLASQQVLNFFFVSPLLNNSNSRFTQLPQRRPGTYNSWFAPTGAEGS
jgi:hypothetical protein